MCGILQHNHRHSLSAGRQEIDLFFFIISTTAQTTLTELESDILGIIEKEISISRKELAKRLNKSEDTIKEYLARLKKKIVLGWENSGG